MTGLTTETAAATLDKFRPACPKCGGKSSYEIGRLSPSSYADRSSEWAERVFSCSCGKQIFGEAIRVEFDRQYASAEEKLAEGQRQSAEAAARQAEEVHRQRLEEARRAAEAAKKLAAEAAAQAALQVVTAAAREGLCAWSECSNLTRKGSLYCSRQCSNKNAHARERARKAQIS